MATARKKNIRKKRTGSNQTVVSVETCNIASGIENKDIETVSFRIYPMLPKGYTAYQRKRLKEYEESILAGKTIDWNY